MNSYQLYFQKNREGELLVELVFRGINKGIVDLSAISYKTDYQLIPKHEEHKYIKELEEFVPPAKKIFSQTVEMPPLLKVCILLQLQNFHTNHTFFSVIL